MMHDTAKPSICLQTDFVKPNRGGRCRVPAVRAVPWERRHPAGLRFAFTGSEARAAEVDCAFFKINVSIGFTD
ncbi:MAG TPA: hypothetical protein DIT01_16160 [Lentisphaeria bacterium]|nr:hypothetical protein [Lentisphaeria bacterium]